MAPSDLIGAATGKSGTLSLPAPPRTIFPAIVQQQLSRRSRPVLVEKKPVVARKEVVARAKDMPKANHEQTRQKGSAPSAPGRKDNRGPERRLVSHTPAVNAAIGDIMRQQEADAAAVISLAELILDYGLPNEKRAQQELKRLRSAKAGSYSREAKVAYKFAHSILDALIAGRRPQNISTPNGSPFPWPTVEQVKGRQRSSRQQCYLLSVEVQAGSVFPKVAASTELRWLDWIDSSAWPMSDRDHHRFLKQVLKAARDDQQPSDILKPDGTYFAWPTTEVGPRTVHGIDEPPVDLGVLRAMGYCVGQKAAPTGERWATLNYIYENPIDDLADDVSNLDEWGSPRSAQRLRKLAKTIASLTRNMKRSGNSELAVIHWVTDLSHLKRTYYDRRYEHHFAWPRTPNASETAPVSA